MPPSKKYHIVEYRYAVRVDGKSDILTAMSKANDIAEKKFGFRPESWYARIFEYSGGLDSIGPSAEFFYNPNSVSYREIDKNWESHLEIINKGEETDVN